VFEFTRGRTIQINEEALQQRATEHCRPE